MEPNLFSTFPLSPLRLIELRVASRFDQLPFPGGTLYSAKNSSADLGMGLLRVCGGNWLLRISLEQSHGGCRPRDLNAGTANFHSRAEITSRSRCPDSVVRPCWLRICNVPLNYKSTMQERCAGSAALDPAPGNLLAHFHVVLRERAPLLSQMVSSRFLYIHSSGLVCAGVVKH